MALSSGTTARIVDAVTEAAPAHVANPNPLKNKVVHADIRIQSIEDESQQDGVYSQSDELIAQSKPTAEDAAYQKHQSEMQMWWDQAIAKNLNLPDGYTKVAVLLIKWADEVDDLKTGKEAKDLETLFRDRFHYHTKTVELNVRKKPQHQLNSHVSDFIRDNDGSHNLLIVYYTGHGVYREDKRYLELTGSIDPSLAKGFRKDARCNWKRAEEKLGDEEVEGDVLTILDTCYSSNVVVKSSREDTRKFELLSACAIDQTTSSPGSNSFTRALIDALEDLLKEHIGRPFSTFGLNQRILLDKRRSDTPSHLWSLTKSVRQTEPHILLGPLKPPKADAFQHPRLRVSPKGYLTLRFGLRDASLNQEQIEFMTKALGRAFNGSKMVGLRRIDWLDMKSAPPIGHFERVALVIAVVRQWKRVITRKREQKKQEELRKRSHRSVDDVTFSRAMEVESASSPQKRRHDDVGEIPEVKRRYLEASQAPSPPISDSSRIDYDN